MINLSERFESDKILKLLSRALPFYNQGWNPQDEQCGLFGTTDPGIFNMRAVGSSSPVIEYVVRPHIQILCILASYLNHPSGPEIMAPHISVPTAIQQLNEGLRWVCQTHVSGERDVDGFLQRKRWGENWRSGMWASLLALCSRLAKAHIEPELLEAVKRVVAHEASRFIGVTPPSGYENDTKLEENAQDTLVMAWAINLCAEDERVPKWEKAMAVWAVNIASTFKDRADHGPYLDASRASWISTQNLYPDMTAENHGFFHPELLSYSTWVVLAMAAYEMHGNEVPACLQLKRHDEIFDLLLPFCLPSGLLYAPGGQDMPYFLPRPFLLAWGLWHHDSRALRMTERLLSWMEAQAASQRGQGGPWVYGFKAIHEGWVLFFQSLVGFELALLAVLPFPRQFRLCTPGQIESSVDTRRIFPYVEFCFRRNTRTTRSVSWKTLEQHPLVGYNIHDFAELLAPSKAALLGIPVAEPAVRRWQVAFHVDKYQKDGFDSVGRINYYDDNGELLLKRDVRVITWGEEGLVVLDSITAVKELLFEEQYLSPVYLVNDVWTGSCLHLHTGSLREEFDAARISRRAVSCPAFWASIQNRLLVQLIWGRTKGLHYIPGGERNAPAYWSNCRLDTLAVHVDARRVQAGERAYQTGLFLGAGKSPRSFKCTGTPGEFFKGLVIMDGKNTLGLD